MSKKLTGYVFRRIRGRIIPIRKGVQQATPEVNALAEEAEVIRNLGGKKGVNRNFLVGHGADFNVFGKFSMHKNVLKIPHEGGAGTESKTFLRHFPETKDIVSLSKAVQQNLTNLFGIPTVPADVVRFKRNITGIVQPKVKPSSIVELSKMPLEQKKRYNYYFNEMTKLEDMSGLNFDLHSKNISMEGELIDTGLNLMRSSIKKFKSSSMGHELLGTKEAGYAATKISEVRPTSATDLALESGTSRRIVAAMNKRLKEGQLFAKVGENEYKFAKKKQKLYNKK